MNKSIVTSNSLDIQQLVDKWLKDEQNGVQFPVDLSVAWPMTGYKKKQDAINIVQNNLIEGIDFLRTSVKNPSGKGRSVIQVMLTCDGFKQMCLLAKTDQGREIRQYFIECEKKWKLVEQINPSFAQEIEILKLKAEIAKNEAIKAQAEEKTTALRHYVVTALPEPIQQKILGYQTIKEVERIETVIDKSTGKIYDGVGITYIAKALGMNNKEAWSFLEKIGYGANSDKWQSELTAIESKKLSRDDFEYIKDVFKDYKHRQLFLGE